MPDQRAPVASRLVMPLYLIILFAESFAAVASRPASLDSSPPWSLLPVLPLLLLVPGVVRKSSRALSWLCFLLLFYFTRAVLDVYLDTGILGEARLASVSLLFLVAIQTIRQQRTQPLQN